jgi:hypothetical protein
VEGVDAAIDAWIPNIGGFQMTVSDKHGIKGALSDLEKLGNRLYFFFHVYTLMCSGNRRQ